MIAYLKPSKGFFDDLEQSKLVELQPLQFNATLFIVYKTNLKYLN